MPEHMGPERLSSDELTALIKQIATGQGPATSRGDRDHEDDPWVRNGYKSRPTLDAIRRQIQLEQAEIDSWLNLDEPTYVITASGTRRVHKSSCHHVRHTTDRAEAWGIVLQSYDTLTPRDLGGVYRMPHLLTRTGVEALSSYVACRFCAPSLTSARKTFTFPARPMLALSFNTHHIGRAIFSPDGQELGHLISHQRIVSAGEIRSVTTTTRHVISGDGNEKYVVEPKEAT